MNQLELVRDCISMLQPYENKFSGTRVIGMNQRDTQKWKEVYYPRLHPMLDDTTFFAPVNDWNLNYGIGLDGRFNKIEYDNCMLRLYLLAIADLDLTPPDRAYVYSCIQLLYNETLPYRSQGTLKTGETLLPDRKLNDWLMDYDLYLSRPGLICGGEGSGATPGADGKFDNYSLLHFLCGCAKYLYMRRKVPVWKLLFLYYPAIDAPEGKAGSGKDDLEYCQKISEKMGKYLFAFSGGKVIAEAQFVNANRALTSLSKSNHFYYIGVNDVRPELEKYAPVHGRKPEKDMVMAFARFDKIPKTWGIAQSSERFCSIALSVQKPPSLDNLYPEGGGDIHELLHILQYWGRRFGVEGVNPDKMQDYGYSGKDADIMFYRDILHCNVLKPGTSEHIGITDTVWQNPPHIKGI